MSDRVVRIGGASGFWGDTAMSAPQLVRGARIDYLVFDYLAEVTMSILASQRLKDPAAGYATDFVHITMKALLPDLISRKVRVVANAGGVNPLACRDALAKVAQALGVPLKIGVVLGDEISAQVPALRERDTREMYSGEAMPPTFVSVNAYLGAIPIARALDQGCDVVITGRCVDSAVTLGVLMHEFGWREDDHDRLAQGTLAGHLIECGAQCTGGLFTDWDTVPDWAHIGYPIVECKSDASFAVTKPKGTGGLIAPQCVAEQLVYEIHDPARYLLPDVVCDFTQVQLAQVDPDHVRVTGARGKPPTGSYKVSATYMDGFKTTAQMTIVGFDAVPKAKRTGEAILERVGELLQAQGLAPFSATHLEVLGAESSYGPLTNPAVAHTREAILRLTVRHPDKAALQLLSTEVAAAGTSWAPGTTGFAGRAGVSPLIRQYAFLLDKARVNPAVTLDGALVPLPLPLAGEGRSEGQRPSSNAEVHESNQAPTPTGQAQATINLIKNDTDAVEVPLIRLAWARSGDKGDTSNIGVIARKPEWLPLLREQLTEARVAQHLAHLMTGHKVTRYELPGIHAFNFVCEQALGGGGMASMRNDSLGKGMGQILLALPVKVPKAWVG